MMDALWLEAAIIAFTTLFALVDPIGNAAIFASLAGHRSPASQRKIAFKATAVATVLLLVFMFVGEWLLRYLGISLAAMRTSGGILLLIMGIDMVFAMHTGGTSTTDEEEDEAQQRADEREDISVFPMAMPLIAGSGSISAVILLRANAQNAAGEAWQNELATVGALLAVMLVTLVSLLAASQLQRLLGKTGLNVITRVLGVILCALAVQFIFDGLAESGLFS